MYRQTKVGDHLIVELSALPGDNEHLVLEHLRRNYDLYPSNREPRSLTQQTVRVFEGTVNEALARKFRREICETLADAIEAKTGIRIEMVHVQFVRSARRSAS